MHTARVPDEQVTGLLTGVNLLRLAVLAWAAVVLVIDVTGTTEVDAVAGSVLLAALVGWTAGITWWTRRRPALPGAAVVVPLDVAVAAAVAAADHLVYDGDHPQTFASAWPLGAVVAAGILAGPTAGAVSGAVVGLGAAAGTALLRTGGLTGRWTAATGTLVLLILAGMLAGIVTGALRRAEVSAARDAAREEVARRLHDGVLQTLAVVQRRSEDRELVSLARDQELELRRFIDDAPPPAAGLHPRGGSPGAATDLLEAIRAAAVLAERRTGVRCEVVVVDEPGPVAPAAVDAVSGAVTEAVTNADKHGSAHRVVICIEDASDGAVSCTVTDDGDGFDPASTPEGVGLSRSIRGRLTDVGGSVQLDSGPGRGCAVRLVVPGRPRRVARRF